MLFDADAIGHHLQRLADLVPPTDPRPAVVLVGGSLLALRDLRASTADIDSVRRLAPPVQRAVVRLAQLHDLPPGWLNDSAAAFAPATLAEEECSVLLDHPNLLVLGAPLEQVFLMKLFAARTRDVDDLIVLWPRCDFSSPEHAVEQFRSAYPHEEVDPHLERFVADIADPGQHSA